MATFVALSPDAETPLHRQVYDALRRAIVAGHLAPAARLPSTRALAEQLDVSRNTVMNAFEQLLAEGYLVGRLGSGTYVADELPDRALAARPRASPPAPSIHTARITPSRRAETLTAAAEPFRASAAPAASPLLAFRLGAPDHDHFPAETWGRLLTRRWNRSRDDLLRHRDPRGYAPLRRAVCDYVNTARGVRCSPEQILIVTGTQQAVSLTAQVVLDHGRPAWFEDPGYPFARAALVAAGATIVPVPVDDEGLDVAAGLRAAPDARLAVVTPAHQSPLGVPLSPDRRATLLDWARRADAWIFEDDYDSEYRYAGRPLPALQGEPGTADRVIYCGTFSKVLSPSIRLAYVVCPPALLDAFLAAKVFADIQCPALEQAVLTDFITGGHFARHIRRTRVLYAKRQALLMKHAARELAGLLTIHPRPAGMHVLAHLPPDTDDREVARRAAEAGVETMPLSVFTIAHPQPPALLLGYAATPDAQIVEGLHRLRRVLQRDEG
jgi:GntR family transcriptional regulator/MocR family aminotransferase